MHRRQFLRSIAASGVLASGLAGCVNKGIFNVGIHHWIGYEPLYLAEHFGWLPGSVRLVHGAGATASVTGLIRKELCAAALTLDEVLRVRAAGIPLTVCTITDVSAGADALMAGPEIGELADLAGKTLAVERSALGALILEYALDAAGLGREDVRLVDLTVDRHLDAWRSGQVDAVISYEPTVSRLADAGARRVFDSRQIPDAIFDVLAVNPEKASSAGIRDLVHGHFRGLDHLLHNTHDALYRVATHQGVTPGQVRRALSGVMLPDVAANYRYLARGSVFWQAARHLSEVMAGQGLLPEADRLEGLLDDRWLPAGVV